MIVDFTHPDAFSLASMMVHDICDDGLMMRGAWREFLHVRSYKNGHQENVSLFFVEVQVPPAFLIQVL